MGYDIRFVALERSVLHGNNIVPLNFNDGKEYIAIIHIGKLLKTTINARSWCLNAI
jgi:hypothetical protein